MRAQATNGSFTDVCYAVTNEISEQEGSNNLVQADHIVSNKARMVLLA